MFSRAYNLNKMGIYGKDTPAAGGGGGASSLFWSLAPTGNIALKLTFTSSDGNAITVDQGNGTTTDCASGVEQTFNYTTGTYEMRVFEPERVTEIIDAYPSSTSTAKGTIDYSAFVNATELKIREEDITEIDVTQCAALTTLWCYKNALTATALDNVFVALDGLGLSNGTVYCKENPGSPDGERSAAGATAKANLVSKGWSVVIW